MQVDFYILHTRNRQEKERFACQLTNKVWHQDYRIYIHTEPSLLQRLDMMLWTFKEESFLAHDIYPDVSSSAPIRIGCTEQVCEEMDVLINLTEPLPPFFEHYERIAEIVDDTPSAREAGRVRYRFYKEKGYVLKTHDINR
jgi:DNA polymerase-3 subunit chi